MSEVENATAATAQTNGNANANNDEGEKQSNVQGKLGAAKDKLDKKKQKIHDKNNPPGGYDPTPIPPARDGYTVKITFHRAENLPISDLNSQSTDPYIHATLNSALPKRHKEDPDLILRTPTIHKQTNPEWNTQWIVAGIPSSGFRLKCRLYDEDASDHDDRLGNVTVYVDEIGPNFKGFREKSFEIEKRMASKRAMAIRAFAVMCSPGKVHMGGTLWLSIELVGESDKPYGRMYTVGETWWVKHYSPMIGRLVGTKAPGSSKGVEQNGKNPKTERYE